MKCTNVLHWTLLLLSILSRKVTGDLSVTSSTPYLSVTSAIPPAAHWLNYQKSLMHFFRHSPSTFLGLLWDNLLQASRTLWRPQWWESWLHMVSRQSIVKRQLSRFLASFKRFSSPVCFSLFPGLTVSTQNLPEWTKRNEWPSKCQATNASPYGVNLFRELLLLMGL